MAEAILTGIMAKARACFTDTLDYALVVAGIGSSVSVRDLLKAYFPEQTEGIADETLIAGAGFALFYWGDRIHPRLMPLGLGILLSGLGTWSSAFVAGFWDWLKPKT